MTHLLNETCWIQEIFLDGSGEPEDVPLHLVLRIRQLRMTNKPYEQFNIAHTQTKPTPLAISKSEGILFCRFRFCTIYESQAQKKKGGHASFVEKFISSLEPDEIDAGWLDVSSETRSDVAPQSTGASRQNPRIEPVDDDLWIISGSNTIIGDNHVTPIPVREYTFGDVFCGAGGVSCGAKQAGLKVIWAVERDLNAATNFHQNFPTAVCEVASVEQFINFSSTDYKVDIMHVSPPCPSFSPMQTVKGKDFEEKQVVILSLNELVKMVRPRIVTMEETFGLLFQSNSDFFATVVRTLNDYRYSVRWRILDLSHYGAPQARRRLIVIAAGYALDCYVSPSPN
jgi:DNA (cytosine-5)-methyltransferase 1